MSRNMISIHPAALKRLEMYDYPGNVRELENMIERAIVVGNDKEIRVRDLPFQSEHTSHSIEGLSDLEKRHIAQILNKYDWNISRSAKALKVDRVTLYNKIKKYDLKPSK